MVQQHPASRRNTKATLHASTGAVFRDAVSGSGAFKALLYRRCRLHRAHCVSFYKRAQTWSNHSSVKRETCKTLTPLKGVLLEMLISLKTRKMTLEEGTAERFFCTGHRTKQRFVLCSGRMYSCLFQ